MFILLKFWWCFCAFIWWIIIYFFIPDITKWNIDEVSLSKSEFNKFRKRLSIAIGIPFALLQIFQLAGGYEDPFFITSKGPLDFWRLLSWGVIVICYILLLYWLWFRSGAEYLSKFTLMLFLPKQAKYIRLIITFIIVVLFFAGLISTLLK